MDLIGKYLRLRRELLSAPGETDKPKHVRRIASDLKRVGKTITDSRPDKAPFLETMPWMPTDSGELP